jgi:CheY-like chemotaxis protein
MDKMTSSSSGAAAELRDSAAKMIAEANREMRKLFRTSRKIQLFNRPGVVLLVDDMPPQKSVLEKIIANYKLELEVVNVMSAADARAFISNQDNKVRLVVIDIMLLGSAANADGSLSEDGLSLVDWINKNHSDIPYIITTGHAERADEATSRFPGIDVLLKGQTDLEEYADAIGLGDVTDECSSGQVIPFD